MFLVVIVIVIVIAVTIAIFDLFVIVATTTSAATTTHYYFSREALAKSYTVCIFLQKLHVSIRIVVIFLEKPKLILTPYILLCRNYTQS